MSTTSKLVVSSILAILVVALSSGTYSIIQVNAETPLALTKEQPPGTWDIVKVPGSNSTVKVPGSNSTVKVPGSNSTVKVQNGAEEEKKS